MNEINELRKLLDEKDKIIERKNIQLKEKEEILKRCKVNISSNHEEVQQKNNEILTLREEIEKKSNDLENFNKRFVSSQKIIEKAYRNIKEKEKELKIKNEELIASEEELRQQNEELITIEEELRQQNEEIFTQREVLEEKTEDLEKSNKRFISSQKILKTAYRDIKEKEKELKIKNEELTAIEEELRQQNEEIITHREELETKTEDLEKSNRRFLSSQKIIEKAYKNIKEKEKELKVKNEELIASEEELRQQNEEILAHRNELEKLSIVASKTDNAVTIFDKDFNIEWVNDGFTRIYGYNFKQFTEKIGHNLIEVTSNPKINEILKPCIKDKQSVIYQSQTTTAIGKLIWTQTTLTPILDENNNIKKFISIDSDIQKIKEAEKEIAEQKEELLQKNEILDEQNKHIKSSINYAKTIQQAILPSKTLLDKYFENFILYHPKDIVSGDFFWFKEVLFNDINYLFYIVADCTGHGVPGAFMSMIGHSILNSIILEAKNIKPARILDLLNEQVISSLNQRTTSNSDGMDVCICRITKKKEHSKVLFAGARRPLIYYNSAEKEMKSITGTYKGIGGIDSKKRVSNFEQKEITVNKNDILYLTSDGYCDQNSFERKRIGEVGLTKMLHQNAEKDLNEQKQILTEFLYKHMKNTEQRDDITILALKI